MSRRRLVPALLALAVALGAGWYLAGLPPFGGGGEGQQAQGQGPGGKGGQGGGPGAGPVPVEVRTVGTERVPIFLEYTATASAPRQVALRPRVSGYVTEVNFKEGADVEAGQVLFRIDPRPFEIALQQAQAEKEAAEAQLAFAESQVQRVRPLANRGYATEERRDQVVTDLRELRGRIALLAAQVDRARLDLEFATVSAPFAGRVGLTDVEAGDLVEVGAELATLVELSPIEAGIRIGTRDPDQVVSRLGGEGLLVEAVLPSGETFPHRGRLSTLDNRVDPTTGTLAATALFPNPEKRLLPGQFLRVRVVLEDQDAVLVPTAALSANQDRRIVYVVGEDGRAKAVPVTPGRRYGDRTLVEQGLEPGARLITSNLQNLRGGAPVQVVGGGQAAAAPTPAPPGL